MKNNSDQLNSIRRNYRIKPSEELINFWESVEHNKLNSSYINYQYFRIKLMTLKQVAEFNYKDIRFWFKKKGEYFLVRYYIPIAEEATFSRSFFIAGYNELKNFIGVFLVNLHQDPIFITADLFSLLKNTTPDIPIKVFIEKEISKGVRKEFDFNHNYWDEEHGLETPELFNQHLSELLEFIKTAYNAVDLNFDIKLKQFKKSFKITFINKENKKWRVVKHEIDVPILNNHADSSDIILPVLNRINFQLWHSSSNSTKEYGFYRLDKMVALLHIEQICKYMRLGVIPHFNNSIFPSIIYSSHPSGYRNSQMYEIVSFETPEEFNAYCKKVNAELDLMSVRSMEEKDIPMIVDYFLDNPESQLSVDGFDINKIPFEEELINILQNYIHEKNADKKRFDIMLVRGGRAEGHCYVERLNKKGEAYLYFFNNKGLLKNKDRMSDLLKMAIELILQKSPLKTIYAEPTKEDEYRNEILKKIDFEFVKKHKNERDSLSGEHTFNLWKLDCDK